MAAYFISFEGLDGSGKSSHLQRLSTRLTELEIAHEVTAEPGGTELGREIRNIFLDRRWKSIDGKIECLMLFASRRQQILEVIEPALAAGRHVLCDRFTDSTLAYQGGGRGVSKADIEALERISIGGLRPDRTILFDLPLELARRRVSSPARARRANGVDRLDVEELEFYARVRESYGEIMAGEPQRFRVVDSSGTLESTQRRLRLELKDLFGDRL
ncbi:MAG: dTMP kinase [Thermoanaerobaculia bacterium]